MTREEYEEARRRIDAEAAAISAEEAERAAKAEEMRTLREKVAEYEARLRCEVKEAEEKRLREESDRKLQQEKPWEWARVKRMREEAEKRRKKETEKRRSEARQRIELYNRSNEWSQRWTTETLEDIADEMLKAEAVPDWLTTFASPSAILDIHKIWLRRIKDARRRALGRASGK